MTRIDPTPDATRELLMQQATGQLTAAEAATLAAQPDAARESARWALAAGELTAALHDARGDRDGALPEALAARLVAQGEAVVRATTPPRPQPAPVPSPARATPRGVGPRVVPWAGWMAAAAALVLWVVAPRDRTPQGAIDPSPVAALAALRDTLTADGVARTITWRAAGDPTGRGATGDVTWQAVRQAGVMRFVGLAPNEAHRWQYQLWIFDRRRDQRYPVDGGVFDVPDGAREVLVRIDPRVPVGEAVAFAVTVEPAGGVVVSTRERVALLADGAE